MTKFSEIRDRVAMAYAAIDGCEVALGTARRALAAVTGALDELAIAAELQTLLSVSEVVSRYKVKRRTVLEARRNGHLRGMKPGGTGVLLFELAAVEEWLQGRSSRLRVVK